MGEIFLYATQSDMYSDVYNSAWPEEQQKFFGNNTNYDRWIWIDVLIKLAPSGNT